MSDKPAKPRMGRPPKTAEKDGPARTTYSVRLSSSVRANLLRLSDLTGKSLSEVIEDRLTRSFAMSELYGDQDTQNLAAMVCHAGRAAQAMTGHPWHQNDRARRGVSRSMRVLAALIEPRGDRTLGALSDQEEQIAMADGKAIAEAAWTVCNPLTGPDPEMQRIADHVYAKLAGEIERGE